MDWDFSYSTPDREEWIAHSSFQSRQPHTSVENSHEQTVIRLDKKDQREKERVRRGNWASIKRVSKWKWREVQDESFHPLISHNMCKGPIIHSFHPNVWDGLLGLALKMQRWFWYLKDHIRSEFVRLASKFPDLSPWLVKPPDFKAKESCFAALFSPLGT